MDSRVQFKHSFRAVRRRLLWAISSQPPQKLGRDDAGISSGTIGGREAGFPGFAVSIGTVNIGGSLVGGSAVDAKSVTAYQGSLVRLTIKGAIIGGSHSAVSVDGRAGVISIAGSVLSGAISLGEGADSVSNQRLADGRLYQFEWLYYSYHGRSRPPEDSRGCSRRSRAVFRLSQCRRGRN